MVRDLNYPELCTYSYDPDRSLYILCLFLKLKILACGMSVVAVLTIIALISARIILIHHLRQAYLLQLLHVYILKYMQKLFNM